MIEQRDFDEAERMLADGRGRHSEAFHEGRCYAMAWCLAGKPAPTPERNRETACPYERGTAECDAWNSGWHASHRLAVNLRIVAAPGVIHEFPLDQGGSVVVREPELGAYAWEVVDEDGETLREAGGYPSLATVLRDALEEVVAPRPSLEPAPAANDGRLSAEFGRYGPTEETCAWLPREAAEFVALVKTGRVADPQKAALAWLMMRHGEVLIYDPPGLDRDDSPTVVYRHIAELRAAGAEVVIDVEEAQSRALMFRANIEND